MEKDNYKLSYYNIFSDPVNSNGDRIIFGTRSAQAYFMPVNYYDKIVLGKLSEVPDEVFEDLVLKKMFVPVDEKELEEIVRENNEVLDNPDKEMLYEVIQPSAMCQLGCYYCGQQHTKDYLNHDVMDKIVSRIRHKLEQKPYKRLHIGWFGAEPLMGLRQMRELTVMFKQLCEEFNLTYSSKIVTNGLSLKENIFEELVNDLKVNSIEVTLDGTAEFHDTHRYTKEKGPSFNLILNNLLTIFNKENYHDYNCGISIRCNVDADNVEGVTPLINLLASHNLQDKISHFYAIGIYSWGNDAHLNSLTKEKFAELEIDWFLKMIELGFSINAIPGRSKQVCMAVTRDSDMYDAFGNIFNCTELSYVPVYENTDYILGNVKTTEFGETGKRAFSNWNNDLLEDKYDCHTCKMLPVCGGGCPKSWAEGNRACPTPKFNIKERLQLYYIASQTSIRELLLESK
jgi:uncharacterized protein